MTDGEQLKLLSLNLEKLTITLQRCIADEDWALLAQLDRDVNRLVRTAIEGHGIAQPSINRKVMAIKRMYQSVVNRLSQERQGIHQELSQAKRVNDAQKFYLAQAGG